MALKRRVRGDDGTNGAAPVPRPRRAPASPRFPSAMSAAPPEFASYEVGAGVESDAPRRPFLRAVLADDAADIGGAADDAEVRELVVRDRFARLDAGLPPLSPGPEPDEILMPPARPATAPAPARPAFRPDAVRFDDADGPARGSVEKEEDDSADEPRSDEEATWDEEEDATCEPPDPEPPREPTLFRPMTGRDEPAAAGPAPAESEPVVPEPVAPEPAGTSEPPAAPARRIFRRFRG